MILKSLEIANFRKFRDPLRIDGFTDGLNIVVEPNETGKSTLLAALRAALFIRHSAKTALVRSYVPIGDDVAPRVTVAFDVGGVEWTVEKQFIKSPFVRLTGPGGRQESDAAEEALQRLLGFDRGNANGTDPETRGPLGLLWVEQVNPAALETPTKMVRDTVRGVLEAEVGAVTGGRRFDAISKRVEDAYSALRTVKTGQAKGDLAIAETRVSEATAKRQAADVALRGYEQYLSDLETARARLKIVERDLVDPVTAERRRRLGEDLTTATAAVGRLSEATALHGSAEDRVRRASAEIDRLAAAELRARNAGTDLTERDVDRVSTLALLKAESENEKGLRVFFDDARSDRERCDVVLKEARERSDAFAKSAAARRAIDARNALVELEQRERELTREIERAIGQAALDELKRCEQSALEARARLQAGMVKVELELAGGAILLVDGQPSSVSTADVSAATRFTLGDAGSITVHPPSALGHSIEADDASAQNGLAAALAALGVPTYSAAVARAERASSAGRELTALNRQIAAACPGDPTIGLAKGADALRSFVAALDETSAPVAPPSDNIKELEAALLNARASEAGAAARHSESLKALSRGDTAFATVNAQFAAAEKEAASAAEHLSEVGAAGDAGSLAETLLQAQRDRAARFEALETARDNARSFDADAIRKSIGNIDRATVRAGDDRIELSKQIASLEATVARDGMSGPAGLVADAADEAEASMAARDRLRNEADVLGTLRAALAEAASDASRTFLGPVTRRAARYVHQLLPGCDLSFDGEFGLTSVLRRGVDESCSNLSRGTQEQLAILTRLAFADLLLEDGAPISLILDDPLVYSDDARLEVMTDMLQEASTRMQVILLTCRSKAFRHVDGNRILLK